MTSHSYAKCLSSSEEQDRINLNNTFSEKVQQEGYFQEKYAYLFPFSWGFLILVFVIISLVMQYALHLSTQALSVFQIFAAILLSINAIYLTNAIRTSYVYYTMRKDSTTICHIKCLPFSKVIRHEFFTFNLKDITKISYSKDLDRLFIEGDIKEYYFERDNNSSSLIHQSPTKTISFDFSNHSYKKLTNKGE